jgi:hypothetical protein
MNTVRLRQARRIFASPTAPVSVQRSNARKWARALRYLGPKWLGTPMETRR